MKTPDTTLLPAVVEQAVKPKPTKREVLDALATLHIEGIKKENERRAIRRKELDAAIEGHLKTILHKKGQSKFKADHSFRNWDKEYRATLSFDFTTDDIPLFLRKMMDERDNSEHTGIPYHADVRRKISQQMAGMAPHDERVKALLESTESRAALETMLAALSK